MRWRRPPRRGVSNIIGVILLLALTIVAGTILWAFRPYIPNATPSVQFYIHSGGSNPVWGDPTDCQPQGHWIYPFQNNTEINNWNNGFLSECAYPNVAGNYSQLNTSQFIISAVSPSNIPLTEINFTFLCNGTHLVQGSLAAMTWIPGSTYAPAANAPGLGYCGTFNASGNNGAFGTLYNRLGIFVPLRTNETVLTPGDTFILYIHNGGYPLDYSCMTQELLDYYGLCDSISTHPLLDYDDYHGAPPWCFTNPGQCTIYLTYESGGTSTLLATIPVYSLAPPTA